MTIDKDKELIACHFDRETDDVDEFFKTDNLKYKKYIMLDHDTGLKAIRKNNSKVILYKVFDTNTCKEALMSKANINRGSTQSSRFPWYYPEIGNMYIDMIRRCYVTNSPRYNAYGGRGIKICREWYNPEEGTGYGDNWNERLFFNEWCNYNGYIPGMQIDRYDNDGMYEPSNCQIVTQFYNQKFSGTTNVIHIQFGNNHIFESENGWSEILNLCCFTALTGYLNNYGFFDLNIRLYEAVKFIMDNSTESIPDLYNSEIVYFDRRKPWYNEWINSYGYNLSLSRHYKHR